jgi:hypothetical protein
MFRVIAAASLAFIAAGAVQSEASTVSGIYTGHITDVNFGDVVPGAPNINVNDTFQISYTYDTTAPVTGTRASGRGKTYTGGNFTLTTGGSQIVFGSSEIDVTDYPDTGNIADSFEVTASNLGGAGSSNIPGWSVVLLYLSFYFPNTTLASPDLPLTTIDAAKDYADYVQITLRQNGSSENYYIIGELGIASTPIPAALPLFASALGGLGFLGWRRRKNAQNAM